MAKELPERGRERGAARSAPAAGSDPLPSSLLFLGEPLPLSFPPASLLLVPGPLGVLGGGTCPPRRVRLPVDSQLKLPRGVSLELFPVFPG